MSFPKVLFRHVYPPLCRRFSNTYILDGVLGSCELLAEELSNRKLLENGIDGSGATASTILNAIRDSGKELMSTVNNILKLNRWAETTVSRKPVGPQDWTQFEEDILYEVDQAMPDHEATEVSIFFNNHLARSEPSTNLVDMALLKECVQSLVLNSLQATKHGAVVIVIDASADRSVLTVDVMDSGCGIAPSDYARIFEAYEKVDSHSRGAGLGLTLAANIAKLMQGDVVLVSSSQGPQTHGSHFRATVATPFQSSPSNSNSTSTPSLTETAANKNAIPFHLIRGTDQDAGMLLNFASYLEQHGFEQTQSSQKSFSIIPYNPESMISHEETASANNPGKLFISLVPSGTPPPPQTSIPDRIQLFPGPFTSTQLQQIIANMKQAWQNLQANPSSPTSPTSMINTTKSGQYKVSTDELLAQEEDTDELPAAQKKQKKKKNKKTAPFALLVDDNMVNLKIMKMYCLKRGIEHITAINGEEAVQRFTEQWKAGRPLNLILMDLQMPVCDGLEAVQRIRAIEKNSSSSSKTGRDGGDGGGPKFGEVVEMSPPPPPPSRIFMVTGQDSSADKARSFAAGADEFYVKPMGMKKLDLGIVQYFGSSVFQKPEE